MNKSNLRLTLIAVCLVLCSLPSITVHSAGGRIEGRVTDSKGAVVVGAAVSVTESKTNQTFAAVTDEQGRFKIEGVPAGTYTLTVSAQGFADFRREEVRVDDGASPTIDVKLDVGPVEVAVKVAAKTTLDPVYQQLRQLGKPEADFGGAFATVTNLELKRDAAAFTLRSGEIYFASPIEGHVTAAVFIGEGELTLTPPTPVEKHTLSIFTNAEALAEGFSRLIIRFTDKTFDEIKASPKARMGNGGPQAAKARDLYRNNQQLLRRELRDNRELRTLMDIYAPQRPGYFNAFITGKKYEKLVFLLDPLGIPQVSPEEVALFSYGESDRGVWTAFHLADEYRKGTASSSQDHRLFDITRHEIDGVIKGTQLTVTDRVTLRPLVAGKVLNFDLYRTLRVNRVQDSQGKDLTFIQESKDEDADLGVIMSEPLEVGKDYTLAIQYSGGDALRDSGGGNYILLPRSTWYPNNGGTQFGDRATFDITFHYPKGHMFVATGAPLEPDKQEDGAMVAKWSSGKTELAVAGFNFGRFKKKELLDKETGYNIEFYGNTDLPDELKNIQASIEQLEAQTPGRPRNLTGTTLGAISTTAIADSAISDAQNSSRIFHAYFGKLPYTRLAMSQQPAGFFGQAWPTLVFMPYIAFLNTTQRAQLLGVRGGTDNFWRYVAPHEVSHQWWGHTVGWKSYRDQWMSEGFAEFSSSLYVQYVRRDEAKFLDFWNNQRDLITQGTPQTRDLQPYKVGPVTQGYRLNSGKTGNIAQALIYPKGAYILQMIRMMMYSARDGDQRFQKMMRDLVKTHYNQDISTEDFKVMVEKHMTDEMDLTSNRRMDWFFNQWVYGTEIPSYRFDYQLSADRTVVNGKITQSGVSDGFMMLVPIYADFGQGWTKLGTGTLVGSNSVDLNGIKLPAPAKRMAICALADVLALSIQNTK